MSQDTIATQTGPAVAGEMATGPDVAGWTEVCAYQRLEPERGVAALVGGEQVAIFRTYDGSLYAVGNRDPVNGAYVMSRGIVGSRGDAPTVASPLHKQVYDLRTGRCLDGPDICLESFPIRCRDGVVEVAPRRDV